MNKQKWLDDRYADNWKTQTHLFQGVECEECSAIHGTILAGGVK